MFGTAGETRTAWFETGSPDAAWDRPGDDDAVEAAIDRHGTGLTYSATGLPDGLSISADGVISGAMTEIGTHTVTITSAGTSCPPRSVTFDWIVM